LSIKLVILDGRELLNEKVVAPVGHDLLKLWSVAETVLTRIEPQSAATYQDVRDCLARFNAIDATSQETRYPVRADGKTSLSGITEIDLQQLHDVVERLAAFWDAARTQIGVYLDYKSDMLNEYAPGV
jgi:hypothetical protein